MAITADLIFSELQKGIAADPSVISKIGGVFLFKIGEKQWTVDLKNAPGSVKSGAVGTSDCTITVAETDYVNLMTGKANGQNLFMQGKLKIQGNMGLALKLDKIPKVKPADGAPSTSAPAPAASGSSGSAADKVFEELGKRIAANQALLQQVGGVYQFNLTSNGKTTPWGVDIKNAPGSVKQGAPPKADCTLTTSEDDFIGMMTGKLNSQQLFMQGKLKIAGNMGLAMKLNKLQQAKAAL